MRTLCGMLGIVILVLVPKAWFFYGPLLLFAISADSAEKEKLS